jgi:hypothetical protein
VLSPDVSNLRTSLRYCQQVLGRLAFVEENVNLTPDEAILQQSLKKLENITLLYQKEKFKWLRVRLGHLIVTEAVDHDVEYHILREFVNEFLDFFGSIEDVPIREI